MFIYLLGKYLSNTKNVLHSRRCERNAKINKTCERLENRWVSSETVLVEICIENRGSTPKCRGLGNRVKRRRVSEMIKRLGTVEGYLGRKCCRECGSEQPAEKGLQVRTAYLGRPQGLHHLIISLKYLKDFSGGASKVPMQETEEMRVSSLGQEDPLEEGMATQPSILAWRILWTEEPGGLPSMGSQSDRTEAT